MVKIKNIFISIASLLSLSLSYALDEAQINRLLDLNEMYNIKNCLWGVYLVGVFLFWIYIKSQILKFEIDKKNYIRTITSFSLNFICWLWFAVVFWLWKVILFNSQNTSFLTDKLLIINIMIIMTLSLSSMVIILNIIKFAYKFSTVGEIVESVLMEIKYGGDE